jgi:hypothetical protein
VCIKVDGRIFDLMARFGGLEASKGNDWRRYVLYPGGPFC